MKFYFSKFNSVVLYLACLWCSTWWPVQHALLFMLIMLVDASIASSDVLYMGAGVVLVSAAAHGGQPWMLQLLKCSTLWIVQHGHWEKMLFGGGVAVWYWLYSTTFGGLGGEQILFGQYGTGATSGETTNGVSAQQINLVSKSQGYSIYKVLSFFEHRCFRCLFSIFAAYGNISTTSQYLVLILNNSKSSSFMSLVKKQKSPQGWIETVPTAAATEEENGEEEEKVKRLEELTSSDKKIEQSIQIGTKYVNSQLQWEKQLEDEITSTTEFTKLKDFQNKRQLLIYTPAIPTTFKNVNKFKNLIKWKGCEENKILTTLKNDLESGKVEDNKIQNLMENGKTTAASLILKNNLFQQNLNNKIIWRNSVKSDEWLKLSENRLWANKQPTGLWIDLQDLEFDHHWLFTRSESAERELVSAYDAWVEVHQQVLNLIKKWLLLREEKDEEKEEILEETTKREEELKLLFNQIVELQTTLERCRAALERAWANADQTRGRFSMERIKGSMEVFEQ
uniref:Uncharacterized protein n=1 Tax=Meloidogyne floridensis TaxID=298350 RepID=A0A915PCN8_9BILA